MNENTMPLINKLIEETKNELLVWSKYDIENDFLKPTKKNFFSETLNNADRIIYESSYLCRFHDTSFFLIAYDRFMQDAYVTLYAQTKYSEYSRAYASTCSVEDSNTDEISQLKRLYNLVETYSDIIEDSIRKFINL